MFLENPLALLGLGNLSLVPFDLTESDKPFSWERNKIAAGLDWTYKNELQFMPIIVQLYTHWQQDAKDNIFYTTDLTETQLNRD